jgi:hypothetical protein
MRLGRFLIGLMIPVLFIVTATAAPRQEGKAVVSQEKKKSRTLAESKINSQLLYAIYRKRGETKRIPPGAPRVKLDEKGRAIVTIRARVTKTLLKKIESLGGMVISSFERYNDIRAHMPLEKLEELAASKDVIVILPAEEAITNKESQ